MKNRGPKEQVALRWLDDEQKSGQTELPPIDKKKRVRRCRYRPSVLCTLPIRLVANYAIG
jgi:hypothetical protein